MGESMRECMGPSGAEGMEGCDVEVGEEVLKRHVKLEEETKVLTKRQGEAMRLYTESRSLHDVSTAMGIVDNTARQLLRQCRDRLGKETVRDLLSEVSDSAPESITRDSLIRLIELQHYRCALSGIHLEPNDAALDHNVPISDGGTHCLDNVQWVHKDINAMKGTLDVDEFIRLCKSVAVRHHQLPSPPR